ncbi:MAG: LamB/YcsF family protein [Blastocatellia bacterium]|nr:LamB/YcsF family protein [Blastocatellia bacterium]
MRSIDLNCDLGEGCANDAALMEIISSANIACGGHAGDDATMKSTAELARAADVAVGAHPSYPDKVNFGRATRAYTPNEVYEIVLGQVLAMGAICEVIGVEMKHVKPHGALYNQAADDRKLAASVAAAVRSIDDSLIVFGLSGSFLIEESERAGLKAISEVFADRTYQYDGTLTPRSREDAFVTDAAEAAARVVAMVETGCVPTTSGRLLSLKAETVCLHGDGPHALSFAREIRSALDVAGIAIAAPKGV